MSNSFISLYHPNRVDPLTQSLHLPLPTLLKFSNNVPVLPVTSFHTFLRTHSEHFFHSVSFSTAHKSICFISPRSPCLRTDLATFLSASTLVFATTQDFGKRLMAFCPIPSAPSFRSFVPLSLHSEAFGSRARVTLSFR